MLNQFKQALISNNTQNEKDIEKLVFYNDELIQQNFESYFIPYNNFNELNEIIENKTYFKLINEIQTFSIQQITNKSKIHIFYSNQPNKEIQVCIQNGKSIQCKYQIDSMLINNKIQINLIDHHFYLPYDDCQQIFQINDEIFLIGCKTEINNIILIIIDQNGNIYDSMDFQIVNECKQQIKIFDNMILICSNNSFWIIQVDENKKLFSNKQQINLNQFVEDGFGKIQFASICDNNQIFLSYQKTDIIISIDNQNQYQEFRYDYNHVTIQEYCKILFNIEIDKQINTHSDILQPKFSLNYELQNIKKFNLINNNFICFINQDLLIYHNQDINLTLSKVIDFAQIQKTSIIVTIFENKTITFYQINQIHKWISYQNTKYITILFKDEIFKANYNDIKTIATEKFDAQNITRISDLEKNELEFSIVEHRALSNNEIEQYSPLQLIAFENYDIKLEIETNQEYICQINFNVEVIYVKALQYSNECQSIVYSVIDEQNNSNYRNYIQNCCNNQTVYFKQFSVTHKKQNIYFQSILIFIQDQYELQLFQLSNDCQIRNQQIIKFDYEIISVQDRKLNYQIQLSNGKMYKIHSLRKNNILISEIIEIFNDSQKFLSIIKGQNNSHILLNNLEKAFYFDMILEIDCNIIEIHEFIASKRFLVVCLHQNNSITLDLYHYNQNELVLLYQIPLYNFTFVMPFKITYSDKLFCIVVEKQNFEGVYLFSYNIHYTNAVKSLIFVKKANHQIQFLMFDKQYILLYCGQQLCTLINLNQNLYFFYQNFITDDLKLTSKVTLTVQSVMLNYEKQINLILNYINQLIEIRFRLNIQKQNQILHLDKQNKIMGLHKIFGPINNISLSNECNGTLMSPLDPISNQSFFCALVYENFCYQITRFIYDPFGIHLVIEIRSDLFTSIKLIIYDDFKLTVFYTDLLNQPMILEIDDWRHNNQAAKHNFKKLNYHLPNEELYQQSNILYSFKKHQVIVLDPLNYTQVLFQQEFENDYLTHIIFSQITNNDKLNIVKIFVSQNYHLAIGYLIIYNGIIINDFVTKLTNGEQIIDFQLVKVKKDVNLLKIDIILQKNNNKKEDEWLLYVEIYYDLDTQQIVKENFKHYFRMQAEHLFLKNINQMFLSINYGHYQTNIYFYNLNQDYLSQNFSDYYFLYNVDRFDSVQKYNESFQIMVKNTEISNKEIFLLDIQSYKFISNQNKCLLQLNHDLSSFTVLAMREQESKSVKLLQVILILNFSFILFIISKYSKRGQIKIHNQNNQIQIYK